MSPAHAARLHWESAREGVPAHLELRRKGDFFEREAGAGPLAEIPERPQAFRLHAAEIEGPFFVLLGHHGAGKAGDGRAVGEDVHTTTFVLRLMWAMSRSSGLLL